MEFLEPWYANEDESLLVELQREMNQEHALFGLPLKVLARRQDRDDVLFEIQDCSGRLAEVHLSWEVESSATWPSAKLFSNLELWLESMKRDHEEYEA